MSTSSGGGVISGVLPVDTDGDGEDDTVYFVANGELTEMNCGRPMERLQVR